MRLLGIDYGKKRVGVALTDPSGRFAMPLLVLKNDKTLVDSLVKIVSDKEVKKIVLGRSLDFKMQPNELMEAVSFFKNELEQKVGVPVVYEDEFLTTSEAMRDQGRVKGIDSSAAALILKSFIDKK